MANTEQRTCIEEKSISSEQFHSLISITLAGAPSVSLRKGNPGNVYFPFVGA